MSEEPGLAPVWFVSPKGFTPVALDEDPASRAARFADLINDLYPDVSPQEKLQLVAGTESHLQGLVREGAIYFASFMYALECGDVCNGMVSAFLVEGVPASGVHFVDRVAREARKRFAGESVDVGVVTLPAGRAALVARDVAGPSSVGLVNPSGPDAVEVQRQLEAYLPFSDGTAYLKVAMGTGDLDAWQDLLPVFGGFLAGISFSPYDTSSPVPRVSNTAADVWARNEFG